MRGNISAIAKGLERNVSIPEFNASCFVSSSELADIPMINSLRNGRIGINVCVCVCGCVWVCDCVGVCASVGVVGVLVVVVVDVIFVCLGNVGVGVGDDNGDDDDDDGDENNEFANGEDVTQQLEPVVWL